ncbi:MAG TPA: glycosyltransferase [bacterium]|nr:glycosyltransferase [bacterium]
MKVLVIGPEWFYPITELVTQAFNFHKTEAKYIYYRYKPTEKTNYYLRKLKQFHIYNFFKNKIEKKIEKDIFAFNHENVIKEIKNNHYDLLFIIKGHFIHSETIKAIKEHNKKIKIFIWYIDDPFICWLDNNQYFLFQESMKSIKYVDKIFVFDEYFVDGIKYRLNKETYYLPLAFDDNIYKKLELPKKYNISFIGCQTNERYEHLKLLEDYGLVLFGGDWQELNKHKYGNVVPLDKTNQIYNQSLINFNYHRIQTVYGANTRTFEVPGSGNFLLTDYRKSMEQLFEIGKEIECFKSKEELKEKVKYYLENKNKIFEISEAGYKRAIKEHTYKHRIKSVLEKI